MAGSDAAGGGGSKYTIAGAVTATCGA
jgi:hypothetical protein